jgi:hypothetical protein
MTDYHTTLNGDATIALDAEAETVTATTGVMRGKQIVGGTWWKFYQVTAATNDTCFVIIYTKDVDSETVGVRKIALGSIPTTSTLTAQHCIEMGVAASLPRVLVLNIPTPSYSDVLEITQFLGNTDKTFVTSMAQTFKAVSGNPLSKVNLFAKRSAAPGTCNMVIRDGAGIGGAILYGPVVVTAAGAGYAQVSKVISPVVPMVAGNTYTIHLSDRNGITFNAWNANVYADGTLTIDGVLYVGDLVMWLFTQLTTYTPTALSDAFVYAQPDVTSISYIESPMAVDSLVWTNCGTGVWPAGYVTVPSVIRLDTSDEATFPPNTALGIGTGKMSGMILRPVVANPGDANTIWANSAATNQPMIGALPLIEGAAGAVTANALVRYDGTTGGIVKSSTATVDDLGNLTASAAVSSTIGAIRGRQIVGGTWWRFHLITIATNDACLVNIYTKDVDSEIVGVRKIAIGSIPTTSTITIQHSVEAGVTASLPRVITLAERTEVLDVNQIVYVASLLPANYMWQSFKTVTTGSLSKITLGLKAYGASRTFDFSIYSGVGIAGSLLYGPVSVYVPQAVIQNQDIVISPVVPVVSGNDYTMYINNILDVYFAEAEADVYPDGTFCHNGSIWATDLTMKIYVFPSAFTQYSSFVYAQPDVTSISYIESPMSVNPLVWTDCGTGAWPTGYLTDPVFIRLDTDDEATYPPSTASRIGTGEMGGVILRPVAANPGDANTIWADSGAANQPMIGTLPIIEGPTGGVTDEAVVVFDGTTGGKIKASTVVIGATGDITDAHDITATGVVSADELITATNGAVQGQAIVQGTWWNVYSMTANTSDSCIVKLYTRKEGTDPVSLRRVSLAATASTTTIAAHHDVHMASATSTTGRVVVMPHTTFPEWQFIDQTIHNASMTWGASGLWQTFLSPNSKLLTKIVLYADGGSENGWFDVSVIDGEGIGGAVLFGPLHVDIVPWTTDQVVTVPISPYVQLATGSTYTILLNNYFDCTIQGANTNPYAGGYETNDGIDYGCDLRMTIYSRPVTAGPFDVFVYVAPGGVAYGNVEIPVSNDVPAWTNCGTGVWPAGYLSDAFNILFDTADDVTYPPNAELRLGIIEAAGAKLRPIVANLGDSTTVWVDSGATNQPMIGSIPIVKGPDAAITADSIARYDGTTGGIVKGSSVTVTDTGVIDPVGVKLTPTATNPGDANTIWADSGTSNRPTIGAVPLIEGAAGAVTANALTRYDGTGGGSIKASTVIVDDAGATSGITSLAASETVTAGTGLISSNAAIRGKYLIGGTWHKATLLVASNEAYVFLIYTKDATNETVGFRRVTVGAIPSTSTVTVQHDIQMGVVANLPRVLVLDDRANIVEVSQLLYPQTLSFASYAWQSFKAINNAYLNIVRVRIGATGPPKTTNLTLYDGSGIGGAVLYGPVVITATTVSTGIVNTYLNPTVLLTAGSTYTISLSGSTDVKVAASTTDVYADGEFNIDGVLQTRDMTFTIYTVPNTYTQQCVIICPPVGADAYVECPLAPSTIVWNVQGTIGTGWLWPSGYSMDPQFVHLDTDDVATYPPNTALEIGTGKMSGAILRPVAANPGDANTIWANSGSANRPTIGAVPLVEGPAGAVTANAITRFDGTAGGVVKGSSVTVTDTGVVDPVGVKLTPTAANPGDANTIWSDSGASNRPKIGTLPLIEGAAGTVTANALVRYDGTSGGAVKASTVIVSDVGAMTGVASLVVTGSISCGTGFASTNGQIRGKYMVGGTWQRGYRITKSAEDECIFLIYAKDIATETVSVMKLMVGAITTSSTITVQYDIQAGVVAYLPRILIVEGRVEVIEASQGSSTQNLAIASYAWQSFKATTSTSMSSITLRLGATGPPKTCNFAIYDGSGIGGAVLYGPVVISVTSAIPAPLTVSLTSLVPVTTGNTYTFHVYGSSDISTGASSSDLYADGVFNLDGVLQAVDMAFTVWSVPTAFTYYDVLFLTGTSASSHTYIECPAASSALTWLSCGTGSWPSGYSVDPTLTRFDSSVPATYPPNTALSIGTGKMSGAILRPVAANPGDANTIWANSGSANRPTIGSLPLIEGPAGAVTANSLVRFDGTSGGVVKASSMVIDDAGAITGVASLTTTGSVSAGTSLLAGNGVIRGRAITGNTWTRIYQMVSWSNDSCLVRAYTKNTATGLVCSKSVAFGTNSSSGDISFHHVNEMGPTAYQPRFTVLSSTSSADQLEIEQSTLTGDMPAGVSGIWQTFTSVTGRSLSQVILNAKRTAGAGNGDFSFTIRKGDGIAGEIMFGPITLNAHVVGVYEQPVATITPTVPLVAGGTYTIHLENFLDVSIGCSIMGGYAGGYASDGIITTPDLTMEIYTAPETTEIVQNVLNGAMPQGVSGIWQTFTSVTGNPLSKIVLYAERQAGGGDGTFSLTVRDGEGIAGTILFGPVTLTMHNIAVYERAVAEISPSVPLVMGNTYTIHLEDFVYVEIGCAFVGGYAGGYATDGSTTIPDLTMEICTTAYPSYDIFVLTAASADAYSYVEIPISNGAPVWTEHGSGAWPTGYLVDPIYTYFDTDVVADYPTTEIVPVGYISGFVVDLSSTTVVTIGTAAKNSIARAEGSLLSLALYGTVTTSLAVAGAGGIQTGSSRVASTWYGIYIIGSSICAYPISALLIPSGTAFNEVGYDLYRRVGWLRTTSDATPLIARMTVDGNSNKREAWYSIDMVSTGWTSKVLDSISLGITYITLDLNIAVPPTSKKAFLHIEMTDGNPPGERIMFRPTGTAFTTAYSGTPYVVTARAIANGCYHLEMPTSASQQIDCAASFVDMTCMVYVSGFEDWL